MAQTNAPGRFIPDPPPAVPLPAAAGPAETSLPAAASGPQASDIRWLRGVPPAGASVRIRLRDSALSAVLDPAQQWELVVVDATGKASPLAAQLEMPAGEAGWPVYTVGAAFGASRNDLTSGDSFWPLLLPDNRLPLAKLKLVASVPAEGAPQAKAVDIVRLDSAGSPLRSLASGVVSPAGMPGAEPNWFILSPDTSPDTWAVQVHDRLGSSAASGTPPNFLQLSKVDAYAAEVLLSATLPEQGVLQLRVRPRTGGGAVAPTGADAVTAPISAATDNPAAAAPPVSPPPDPVAALTAQGPVASAGSPASPADAIAGEFTLLRALSPAESAAVPPTRPTRMLAGGFAFPGWLPALGLGLVGALLLWFGLKLLRPLPEHETND
jgi:hypothetical protein